MILNQAALAAATIGFNRQFEQGFDSLETEWQALATLIKSGTKQEQYNWLGQFPKMREWIGDRHVKAMRAHTYTIINKKFEGTVDIPADDFEDDQIGTYGSMFEDMGYAAKTQPDELLFELIENGTTELCYDGQPMFNANHPKFGTGLTQSNYQGGSGDFWALLDLRRPLKPFIMQERRPHRLIMKSDPARDENMFWDGDIVFGVDGRRNVGFGFWQQIYASHQTLNAANYNAAWVAMMELESDEGRRLGIRPTHILHGASNRDTALTLLTSERLSNGESNINKGTVAPLLSNYI